ncbi:head-tail connector protein [Sphingomonas sp. Leaf37]|uniref:head-tail connector protein n=1 Tax=Sphingomonas sp. Leaf37 TaxID=2876552 RepID=UPI001E50EE15|nr:head-tail connector protein [Sphingomonas sp. Leaf37]
MAEPVALDDIKAHLRLNVSATDEDTYLVSLLLTARRKVEKDTGHIIAGDAPTIVGDDLEIARHAMRLIVGHWYANREATAQGRAPAVVPMTASWLIDSIKLWDDGSEIAA